MKVLNWRVLLGAWLVLGTMGLAATVAAVEPSVDVGQAVVRIMVRSPDQFGRQRTGFGSGVHTRIGEENLVLTVNHVVDGCRTATLYTRQGGQFAATVLATDRAWDCAVLSPDRPLDIPAVEMAWGETPDANQTYTTCGFDGRTGQFSAFQGRFMGYMHNPRDPSAADWMQISSVARQGDSGGPVFNQRGNVMGVLWGTDGRYVACLQPGRLHLFLRQHGLPRYRRPQIVVEGQMVPVQRPGFGGVGVGVQTPKVSVGVGLGRMPMAPRADVISVAQAVPVVDEPMPSHSATTTIVGTEAAAVPAFAADRDARSMPDQEWSPPTLVVAPAAERGSSTLVLAAATRPPILPWRRRIENEMDRGAAPVAPTPVNPPLIAPPVGPPPAPIPPAATEPEDDGPHPKTAIGKALKKKLDEDIEEGGIKGPIAQRIEDKWERAEDKLRRDIYVVLAVLGIGLLLIFGVLHLLRTGHGPVADVLKKLSERHPDDPRLAALSAKVDEIDARIVERLKSIPLIAAAGAGKPEIAGDLAVGKLAADVAKAVASQLEK